MINEKEMIITDSEGHDHVMQILFTYENEERKTNYVYLYEKGDEDNVQVYRYDEETHELSEIEDDDEYSECEEVFNCFNEDPKINEIKD